jgi:hypothetical protein
MRRVVLIYGLIAGALLSAMMLATLPFADRIGFDRGMLVGYTTMVLAFLMVFFGIRSYRDNVAGGALSFGRALRVGILITAIASVCYVLTWQLIYYRLAPDFDERYAAHVIEKARAAGESEAAIAARQAELAAFHEWYRNPLFNAAITLLEVLPVGLLATGVSAGILRRRSGVDRAASGAALQS